MKMSIGIDAIAFAVPRAYVELTELAAARAVPPSKYTNGLGTHQMAIADADEDPVALATNAARRLFVRSGRRPDEIGLCIAGTETAVDHSKPIAAYLHGLLGLPTACRVFETKHACFGGTAGLMAAMDWIASGSARGRAALVLCTDIARYELGSAGEPTQGAGAVAFIVSENPRLIELELGRSGSYARDVHDFWRPLHRKDALVDGHFSVQCYLDALAGAYAEWNAITREDGGPAEPLVRTCYHVPYGKMARKAHRHRKQIDGLTEAEADATFATEVESSLNFSAQIGNVYTGSLYLALASLLHAEAGQLEGQRIGLFSYGSGCAAEFFAGRVCEGAQDMVDQLDLAGPLAARERLTIERYEELRRADAIADRRPVPTPPPPPSAQSLLHAAAYIGVDAEDRRVYTDQA